MITQQTTPLQTHNAENTQSAVNTQQTNTLKRRPQKLQFKRVLLAMGPGMVAALQAQTQVV